MLQDIAIGKARTQGQQTKNGQGTDRICSRGLCAIGLMLCLTSAVAAPATMVPQRCQATGTVGFHDYSGGPVSFEPAVFVESTFTLEPNTLLNTHLAQVPKAASAPAATTPFYLTLTQNEDYHELECVPVRLARTAQGLSCTNNPATTLLLYNPKTRRYTRSSLAAWTFSTHSSEPSAELIGEDRDEGGGVDNGVDNGESMYIEHGRCQPTD